ncbi:MAG: hypothetical protein GTN71_21975, partial [Anaerolineae bacterium]|nr:hypothetical protein [Gemmatimonadales bacterium]NIO71621.1 hypothetical protein [Anaerolineae bacterium]
PANANTLDDILSYTQATATCGTANCHGGNDVAWDYDVAGSGSFACDVCHAEVAGVKTGVTDVNSFSFGDWIQTKINDVPTTGEFTASGHGGKGIACTDCHDSAVEHDISAALDGTDPNTANTDNPFRLVDQDGGAGGVQFSCSYNAANCHDGSPTPSVATVVSHTRANMVTAGYSPQVDTWHMVPACVNCHDPHGDDANLSMVQRELYDKVAFTLPAGPPPAEPTEQVSLVF